MSHAAPAGTTTEGSAIRLRFTGVVRSEWIKLWTVRSTWWTLSILIALTVGMSALVAFSLSSEDVGAAFFGGGTAEEQQAQVFMISTSGVSFGALVVSILGALAVTGEYSTGAIRSTFLAVPRRWPALLAKDLVLAAVLFVLGVISALVSYLITAALLHDLLPDQAGLDAQAWRAIIGTGVYLAALALIAAHIGAIVRSTAGAVSIALGLVLVVPVVLSIMAGFDISWAQTVSDWLPSNLGDVVMTLALPESLGGSADGLSVAEGFAGLAAWVVGTGALALVLVRSRDV